LLNYTVDPYELVWNSDYYYLIGKLQNEKEWRHFRVDRIQQMNTLHDSGFLRESFDVTTYLKSLFHMYSGTMRFVRLRLHNHLINVIIDRFGLDVLIKKSGENHFEVMFEAAISTGLIRWVLTWGSDVEVLEPQSLVTNIRDEAGKMFKLYDSR
jgi:predicted DNA-binding transcriptional regulator YafY